MPGRHVTRKHGAKRGFGVLLIVGLLIAAIVLIADASKVPAANFSFVEFSALATPDVADPEPTLEPEASCISVPTGSLDPAVTLPAVDPEIAATPVVVLAELPEECEAVPLATETAIPSQSPLEEPVRSDTSDTTSYPELDTSATKELSMLDPFENGLPSVVTEVEKFADPLERGLPTVSAVEQAIPDPFVAGLPVSVADEESSRELSDSVNDPAMAGIPELPARSGHSEDPMLTGSGTGSQVDVIVTGVSSNGVVTPGGKISYLFQIANPGSSDVVILLIAATNQPGWDVTITQPESTEPSAITQSLPAGGSLEVVVVVTAPLDASVGDDVTTSLTATIQN